jgi:hypothetical protein
MSDGSAIEALYARAGVFFAEIERRLREAGRPFYGFKLLNAPPVRRPNFLFVGYQPGGGEKAYEHELALGSHLRWPDEPEFVTAEWDLAWRMQETFPRDVLLHSMGSNVIFLRWPNVRDYKRTLPPDLRKEIEVFSGRMLCEIANIVEPQRVAAIGFDALRLKDDATTPDLVSPAGRVLTRRGVLCGREVVGMIHLTGCRISGADRQAIKKRFTSESSPAA